MIIDSHQHFWTPARGDYDWIPKGDPVLDRVYLPVDLRPELARHGIEATVLVQAAASVEETEYMLGLADGSDFVRGVVGWVDFDDRSALQTMERLRHHPKFKGLRPMIQDIADPNWMLGAEVDWAFAAMTDLDLTFDALGYPRHLAPFLTLLKRHPRLRVVLDHCLKPEIRARSAEGFAFWAEGMARLAGETGALVKFSALITEAEENWSLEDLRPYLAHILEVFGPERIMWGSDWPVCRLKGEYDAWFSAARALTADLPEAAQARIFGGTAAEFYRL